ncbi:MAG: ankyrin repeat domain-containing protein [Bdellovibrionaceae bacterium]|nr:ankyrin repeat domain-containing protein [Pseudobdellovibrionaceae bacterium]
MFNFTNYLFKNKFILLFLISFLYINPSLSSTPQKCEETFSKNPFPIPPPKLVKVVEDVLPHKLNQALNQGKQVPKISIEKVLEDHNLTNNVENQILFITTRPSYAIRDLHINLTSLKNYLTDRIKDQNLSFKLRKSALFYLINLSEENYDSSIDQIYLSRFLEKKYDSSNYEIYQSKFLEIKDISLSFKEFSEFLTHFSQKEQEIILDKVRDWNPMQSTSSYELKRQFIHSLTISFFMDQTIENMHPYFNNIIDINSKRRGYSPVLIDLIKIGDIDAFNKILKKNVDIQAVDWDGNTALHIASKIGDYAIVKALIESGAILNAKNKEGDTPLDLAKTRKIYTLLKNHGASNNNSSMRIRRLLYSL